MKTLLLVLTAVLVFSSAPISRAQTEPVPVRTVAIGDFADDSADGRLIGATRLNALLQRVLSDRAGARLRVVSTADVRAAMQAQGVTARDLISPTKAIALAQAVGADWIVTGRWTHLDSDFMTRPDPADRSREIVIYATGFGMLDLRILEAATRRIVLQETVDGEAISFSPVAALLRAAQVTLLRAADRILSL